MSDRRRLRLAAVAATAWALPTACRDAGSATTPDAAAPIAVSPQTVACAVGERVRLTARGGRATAAYEFTAADDVVRVRADGEASTATLGCAAVGTTVVIVADGPLTAQVPVRVARTPGAVLGLEGAPNAVTLVTASTWRLAVQARVRDTTVSTAVRYTTTDAAVATVDSTGLVRAVAAGSASVTARAAADPEVRATVAVTVARGSALVQSISINPTSLTLTIGDSARLGGGVLLTPEAPPGTSRERVFSTPDSAIVSVSPTGVVRARRPGIATVFAQAAAAPAFRIGMLVTVREPRP